jgi:hypothetical protein
MPGRVLKAGLLLLVAVWPRIAAPVCIPPIEMPHAKVVRVEKNGVIVLADGRAARLEGVLLAAGATDHAPQSYADQAIATLDDLITDHWVALAAATPKEDRYGRLRAQILVRSDDDAMWVQWEILRRALAKQEPASGLRRPMRYRARRRLPATWARFKLSRERSARSQAAADACFSISAPTGTTVLQRRFRPRI